MNCQLTTTDSMAFRALLLMLAPGVASGGRAGEVRVLRASGDAEVAAALAAAMPGDTIVLADGNYRETLHVRKSGTVGSPVTIKAGHSRKAVFSRKGEAARIDGSFLRLEGLVFDSQYGDCSCVRVTGSGIHLVDCEFRRPGTADGKSWGDGLQFFDSSHCLVERCFIHHCLASHGGKRADSHGIRFTGSRDMTIRGCFIDLVSGDCVQVDPDRRDWDNILIEDCRLSGGKVATDDSYPHPAFRAGDYTAENAVDTKCPPGGRPRITVRNCDVYGFRGPIGNAAAFNIKEACVAIIDRCTIHDCEIGLRLRGPARVQVTNAILHDNDTHCRYEDRIPLLHVTHCTFGRATGNGRGAFQEQLPAQDLKVLGCLFLGERPRQADDLLNRVATAATFAGAATGDYRLAAAVPLLRAGPASDEPEAKIDRAGVPRPADRVADAGAFQFRPN